MYTITVFFAPEPVKEQMGQLQTKIDIFEQQNLVKNHVKQKKPKVKIYSDKKDKRDWKYPTKMK
ncbi:hypothetical protein ACQVTS_33105 [Bacillus mycoides]|uniref:hypothetical protein n=1 Tax=Bacillus mycoides TaxID=1405 RepID=UPI003D656FE5